MFEAVINQNDDNVGLAVDGHFAGAFNDEKAALVELRDLINYKIKALSINENESQELACFAARYVTEWEEGVVQSDCTVSLDDFKLTVTTVDCDNSYNHLEREYIEFEFKGSTYQVEVEHGELTDQGKKDISRLISVDSESKH